MVGMTMHFLSAQNDFFNLQIHRMTNVNNFIQR